MPAYPGTGKATFLDYGQVGSFFNNERQSIVASQAFLLEHLKGAPHATLVEVYFSGAPGAFTLQVQTALVDQEEYFVTQTTISSVNSNNTATAAVNNAHRFIRLNLASIANDVSITAVVWH